MTEETLGPNPSQEASKAVASFSQENFWNYDRPDTAQQLKDLTSKAWKAMTEQYPDLSEIIAERSNIALTQPTGKKRAQTLATEAYKTKEAIKNGEIPSLKNMNVNEVSVLNNILTTEFMALSDTSTHLTSATFSLWTDRPTDLAKMIVEHPSSADHYKKHMATDIFQNRDQACDRTFLTEVANKSATIAWKAVK